MFAQRYPRLLITLSLVAAIVASLHLFPKRLRELIQPTVHAASFVVSTANDHDDGTCNADCTLREAINAANASAGLDVISFSISGGGAQTINLVSPLPAITDLVTIDGTTQNNFGGIPLIELNGTNAAGGNGLNFQAGSGGSTVKALVINPFPQRAINADSASISVQGCYIGT